MFICIILMFCLSSLCFVYKYRYSNYSIVFTRKEKEKNASSKWKQFGQTI